MKRWLKLINMRFISEFCFIISFTLQVSNPILGFILSATICILFENLFSLVKDVNLIDKLINDVVFFHTTLRVLEKDKINKYEFIGFCKLDNGKFQDHFVSADYTQIKSTNGVQYIGYYKKLES